MPEKNADTKKEVHGNSPVSHVERILRLLMILQSGWFTQDELFQHFSNISKRTFYRDLEEVRTFLGDRLQVDARKRFHYDPASDCNFQSLALSYPELLSLYLACQLGLEQLHKVPYLTHLESVLLKLQHLSRGLIGPQDRLASLRTGMEIGPTSCGAGGQWLRVLLEAQEKRVEVFIEYDSIFDGRVLRTSLAPFYIHFNRRAWYVTGRSGYHHEIRTFNMERFLSVDLLPDSRFFLPINWSYERYRGNAWNMIRGEQDSEVRLRFSSLVARNVAEVRWHQTQQVIWNADGTVDLFFTVSGFSEIVWWILGYGSEVEVLSPPALRQLVRARAEKILALYQKDGELEDSEI